MADTYPCRPSFLANDLESVNETLSSIRKKTHVTWQVHTSHDSTRATFDFLEQPYALVDTEP